MQFPFGLFVFWVIQGSLSPFVYRYLITEDANASFSCSFNECRATEERSEGPQGKRGGGALRLLFAFLPISPLCPDRTSSHDYVRD